MKYIDVDKLIALIDTKLEDLGLSGSVWVGRSVLQDLKNDIITSLQQEQPEIKSYIEELLKECAGKDGEYYRGRRETLAHLFAYLGGNPLEYILQPVKQPEVDFEKFTEKIKTFQRRYNHPEIVSIKGAMAFMARMFYQYPNVARQWYESLPKATMDNERKEEE